MKHPNWQRLLANQEFQALQECPELERKRSAAMAVLRSQSATERQIARANGVLDGIDWVLGLPERTLEAEQRAVESEREKRISAMRLVAGMRIPA